MPGPGVGEPDIPNVLQFKLNDVVALSPAPNPTVVVQAGQPITLRVDLGIEGFLSGLLIGEQFSVVHHIERVEDGARTNVGGGIHAVPANPASFSVNTGPISTSQAGGGGQLEVPANFDAGTFRVLTHVHFVDPAKEPIVAAFHDMIVMVT